MATGLVPCRICGHYHCRGHDYYWGRQPTWTSTPSGWQCPICEKVWGPQVAECVDCNSATKKETT